MINKYDSDYFGFYVSELLADTHYVNQDVFINDALSVQSEEYKIIQAKHERYSLLLENKFDFVFSYRRNVLPDRFVILRSIDEFKNNGWFYEEIALVCESLGYAVDKVSLTEEGMQDYFNRIKNKEILNNSGEKLRERIALPKVYFDGKKFTQKKIERTFQKWCICPSCGGQVEMRLSDQKGLENKVVYLCKESDCDFKVALDKPTKPSQKIIKPPLTSSPRNRRVSSF